MSKSGVEHLANHPGWKTRKRIPNGVLRHGADLAVEKFTKTGNAYYRSVDFATKKEADAFKQGVDFVNDSAIVFAEVEKRAGRWVVLIQDDDFDESEGDSESQVVR
jgi:stress response protein SCP2